MCDRRHVNCILPPHILKRMLESPDREIRENALQTMLTTTRFRAERGIMAEFGFAGTSAGGKRRTIFDCERRRVLSTSVLVRAETDGESDDESVNAAHDGLGKTFDFFHDVLGRNSLDNHGMRLDGYVHFGTRYNNAFWNGRQMVFGDGDGLLFTDFTRSLDVIAHELTHGVTEFAAGLEYRNQSGALNESISDVFGSLVKQWALGQSAADADWLIGSDIFSPGMQGDGLRSLKAPGTAYDDPTIGRDPQPAHTDSYVELPDSEDGDFGGVHINSGIPNNAFYRLAIAVGGNAWEAPARIWYAALQASSPTTDFKAFAEKTLQAAVSLYPCGSEATLVWRAWDQVGVRIAAPIATPVPAYPNGSSRKTESPDALVSVQRAIAEVTRHVKALAKDVAELKSKRARPASHGV